MPIVAIVLLCGSARAQSESKPHEIVIVDSVPSSSASELYRRARAWFVDYYKDASEVVQLADSATKTVVGKATFQYNASIFRGSDIRRGFVKYTIEVSCRDGRYRVRTYNYLHSGTKSYNSTIGVVGPDDLGQIMDGEPCFNLNPGVTYGKFQKRICDEELLPQLRQHDLELVKSLQTSMRTSLASSPESDW